MSLCNKRGWHLYKLSRNMRWVCSECGEVAAYKYHNNTPCGVCGERPAVYMGFRCQSEECQEDKTVDELVEDIY